MLFIIRYCLFIFIHRNARHYSVITEALTILVKLWIKQRILLSTRKQMAEQVSVFWPNIYLHTVNVYNAWALQPWKKNKSYIYIYELGKDLKKFYLENIRFVCSYILHRDLVTLQKLTVILLWRNKYITIYSNASIP